MNKLPKPRISMNAPVILTFTLLCLCALILGALTGGRATVQFFEEIGRASCRERV